MKRIFLFLVIALGFSFGAFAQFNTENLSMVSSYTSKLTHSEGPSRNLTDTIWPKPIMTTNLCGDSSLLYIFSNGTLVTGNNAYGFKEIGTRVNHTGAGSVTGALALVYYKGTAGTGTCALKIYSSNNNTPGTLLGTSTAVPMSQFTSGSGTTCKFTFTNPVSITGNFFATVLLPTNANDTIGIYTTSQYCSSGADSLSLFYYNSAFHYYKSFVGFNSPVWIGTIVNEIVGINEANAIENINVYNSNNTIVIKNNSNAIVKQVVVYNLLGQEIANKSINTKETTTLDANLPSATYIVKVITDSKVGTYKLYVNR